MRHRPSGELRWKKGHRGPAQLGQGIIASGRAPGSSAPGHGPSICGHHVSRTETDGDRDIHVNQAQPGRHCPSWFIRGQHLQSREVPPRPRVKGTRNAGPIGSRVTSNSEDQVSQKPRPGRGPRRTHPARLGPSPGQPIHLRPVTAWISTRCTSLQFFLSASEATRGTIIFPFVEVIAPRPSHLVFFWFLICFAKQSCSSPLFSTSLLLS